MKTMCWIGRRLRTYGRCPRGDCLGSSKRWRISVRTGYTSGWIDRLVVPNFPLATNGGLTRGDVLAAPVAAAHRGVNDERLTGARVSLLIKPSDALTITPGVFYQRIGQGGENAYDSDPGPPAHYQLGRLLFIRHSGGISLTDSGVLLYQHAEHV